MSESASTFSQTIQLFLEMALHGTEGAYRRFAPKATVYLKALFYISAVALITIPTLGILKTVTGYVEFGYLMAVAAIFFTLILGLMWSPLSLLLGLLLGETHNPKAVGEKYVRLVATVMFFELVAAMYISYIPLHRQLSSMPIFLIAVVAVILGSAIWGGWLSGKFYTLIALLMVIRITLSAFFPQTAEVISKWQEKLDSNIAHGLADKRNPASASVHNNQQIIRVSVKPDQESDRVTLPVACRFDWEAPGDITFSFPNGQKISIRDGERKNLGKLPNRSFTLRGTAGEAIFTIL